MIQMMITRLFIFFTLLLFVASCSEKFYNPKIERGIFSGKEERFNKSKKITIMTGDTIKSISKRYSISIREIIKFNKLKSPYILKPGKSILLPKLW